jgi:hypothetical protein
VRACRVTSDLLMRVSGKRTRILSRARGRRSSAGRITLRVRAGATARRQVRRARKPRLVMRTTAIDAGGRVEVVDKRVSVRDVR